MRFRGEAGRFYCDSRRSAPNIPKYTPPPQERGQIQSRFTVFFDFLLKILYNIYIR